MQRGFDGEVYQSLHIIVGRFSLDGVEGPTLADRIATLQDWLGADASRAFDLVR